MNMVKIYRDNIDFSLEDVIVNTKNYVTTVGANLVAGLVSVCDNCIFFASLNEYRFTINHIDINDFKIHGNKEFLDNSVIQKFGVKKAYVATVNKDIVDDVINFYNVVENKENNSLVFDFSRELKLQEALNTKTDNKYIESSSGVEKRVEKKQGHISLFLIGLAAVMLTIMSIMIGMKILGIK